MLSVADKLLIAAYRIEASGKSPFTAEDLVVSAWENFRDTFGLSGYNDDVGLPIYPDSNRVFAEIMGSKPIRKRGYLIKVGEKLYRLTESGFSEAKRLEGFSDIVSRKVSISRDIELELRRLLSSRAFLKASKGNYEKITFFDACSFWNISPRSTAIEFEGKSANIHSIVNEASDALQGGSASFIHGGDRIDSSILFSILDLDSKLRNSFRFELSVIQSRTDER